MGDEKKREGAGMSRRTFALGVEEPACFWPWAA